jgi:CO/xanthine dehydrogenase Mo-binding subunit
MATTSKPVEQEFKVIGTRPMRHDGVDKVIGRAVYGADVKMQGLLLGAVLRSPYAHAKIKKIDTSKAEQASGVIAVMTGADLPEPKNIEARFNSERIMARGKVLFKGHPIAAVAATDLNSAIEASKLIEVDYEVLKPVITLEDAMAKDAPILHEDLVGDHLGESVKNTNLALQTRSETGDPEAAFAKSAHVIERSFTIARAHQGYIEPQNATAFWDQNDKITVWTTTQGQFPARNATADVLQVAPSSIKVVPLEIGGGFGGKINIYLEPVAAVLSKKSGQPVKLVMDRRSVFDATGAAPGGNVTIKMGTDDKGVITAATADIRYGAGAFPGASISAASVCVFAAYKVPNVRIDAYDIVNNMTKSAAYRAPGSPQATFATESLVDELCEEIGMDTMAFHELNGTQEGDRRADGPVFPRVGNLECLEAIKSSPHYKSKLERQGPNGRLRGRGMASGYWQGIGNRSVVTLSVNSDGVVSLIEGNTDIGGTRTTIAMQAAEVLGIAAEDVHPSVVDTDSVGWTDLTAGSRTTFATGTAAIVAARQVVEEMKRRAAVVWETEPENVAFNNGVFTNSAAPDVRMTFKEAAGKLDRTGGPINETGSVNIRGSGGGSFATHLIDLEVDPETGKVDILRYTAAQDAGKAVHPSYVEGQYQGGAAQGVGWALNEEYYTTEDGSMVNSSFLDYRMPTSLDMPMIDAIIVEVPNPNHPFGVRGIGETGIVPPAPAVANAIHDALGVRMYQTPMNPARIVHALKQKASGTG